MSEVTGRFTVLTKFATGTDLNQKAAEIGQRLQGFPGAACEAGKGLVRLSWDALPVAYSEKHELVGFENSRINAQREAAAETLLKNLGGTNMAFEFK